MSDCPIPHRECPYSATVTTHQANMQQIMDLLQELRSDMKTVKVSLGNMPLLEQDLRYQKEALDRAFENIRTLENVIEAHKAKLSELRGMRRMAVLVWTVMGSGLGLALFKLFAPVVG